MRRVMLGIAFALIGLGSTTSWAQATFNVGVVLDDETQASRDDFELLAKETQAMSRDDRPVRLEVLTAESRDGIDALLDDAFERFDAVVAVGVAGSARLAARSQLSKPAVGLAIIDPVLQDLPVRDCQGRRDNLLLLHSPGGLAADLEVFSRLLNDNRVAVLVSSQLADANPGIEDRLQNVVVDPSKVGLEVVRQPFDAVVTRLAGGYAGALLVGTDFDPLSRPEVIEALSARGVAPLSPHGLEEGDGMLASNTLADNKKRIARRAALELRQLAIDPNLELRALNACVPRRDGLALNMTVARRLRFSPSWTLITEADLIERSARTSAQVRTLRDAIDRALESNQDYVIEQLSASIAGEDYAIARAPLLPQVSVAAAGSLIDRDRARASFGANSELALNLSASVTQQLISEPAWAAYSIAERQHQAALRLRDAVKLDIVLSAARTYFDVLRARINGDIERDNLRVTRRNLELAKARRDAGSGTVADVHRFESELATAQARVIAIEASRNQAEIALNRLLNRPPEEPFQVEPPSLEDPSLMVHFEAFDQQLGDQRGFRVYREYMSQQALALAPEFERSQALLLAAERAEKSASRAFWVPLFELTGTINRLVAGAGEGSENLGQGNFVSFGDPDGDGVEDGFPVLADRTTWDVTLTATYPLFSGGQRFDERDRAKLASRQERERQEQTSLSLQADVRSAIHAAGASYANIELTAAAAEASKKNLKIITERYARGAEDVVTLIDAQNSALLAELLASVAVYDFLDDYFELQRRSGRFDFLEDDASRDEWTQSFRIFHAERTRELQGQQIETVDERLAPNDAP